MAIYGRGYTDPPAAQFALVDYVMAQQGFQTEFIVVPPKRMPFSLQSGVIDTFQASALARETRQQKIADNFIQSHYPVIAMRVLVYYKKTDQWSPSWPPNESMLNKASGVSLNYSWLENRGYQVRLISSYESGAKIVNSGRADYWVDSFPPEYEPLIKYLKTEEEGFFVKDYFINPLYLLFADTPEGHKHRDAWDKGAKELYKDTNKFHQVYSEHLGASVYYPMLLRYFTQHLGETYAEFPVP